MDTPELDESYRNSRRSAYYVLRSNNEMRGSAALKKLEKLFRTCLWETAYGKTLAKRFPQIPGHVRVSIPLVEYIVPDTRKPVFWLLVEFCKSANTRSVVDDIVRVFANGNITSATNVIKSILYCSEFDEATTKRINQAFNRAKLKRGDNQLFEIPSDIANSPVLPSDLLLVVIEAEENGYGIAYINEYAIRIPETKIDQEYEVLIESITKEYAVGKIAILPEGFQKE